MSISVSERRLEAKGNKGRWVWNVWGEERLDGGRGIYVWGVDDG